MNNHLFSNDFVEDENNKSLFSFLKKPNAVSQGMTNKNREAFNNITNTINKSPFFEEKEGSRKNLENCVPKTLSFEPKKTPQNPSQS